MQGLLAGLLVLSVTYFGGKGLLQRFFFRTGYVYAEETERAEELQEYVTQNKLMTSRFQGENGCCLIFPTTEKLCMAAEKYQI